MSKDNLNELESLTGCNLDGSAPVPFADHMRRYHAKDGAFELPGFVCDYPAKVRVHFRRLEEELCSYIEQADAVVGCVAWLTSEAVLDALAQKENVCIIVQKEDWFRPDLGAQPGWTKTLLRRYGRLKSKWSLEDISFAFNLDWAEMEMPFHKGLGLRDLDDGGPIHKRVLPATCAFGKRKARGQSTPLLHHKFFVFFRSDDGTKGEHDTAGVPFPSGVWTGSFNPTKNGACSLENAIYFDEFDKQQRDRKIAIAFADEWAQILPYTEPLQWLYDDVPEIWETEPRE